MDTSQAKAKLEFLLSVEKSAETNCDQVLDKLDIERFKLVVETIRNDEIEHQKIVKHLIKLLKK